MKASELNTITTDISNIRAPENGEKFEITVLQDGEVTDHKVELTPTGLRIENQSVDVITF